MKAISGVTQVTLQKLKLNRGGVTEVKFVADANTPIDQHDVKYNNKTVTILMHPSQKHLAASQVTDLSTIQTVAQAVAMSKYSTIAQEQSDRNVTAVGLRARRVVREIVNDPEKPELKPQIGFTDFITSLLHK